MQSNRNINVLRSGRLAVYTQNHNLSIAFVARNPSYVAHRKAWKPDS